MQRFIYFVFLAFLSFANLNCDFNIHRPNKAKEATKKSKKEQKEKVIEALEQKNPKKIKEALKEPKEPDEYLLDIFSNPSPENVGELKKIVAEASVQGFNEALVNKVEDNKNKGTVIAQALFAQNQSTYDPQSELLQYIIDNKLSLIAPSAGQTESQLLPSLLATQSSNSPDMGVASVTYIALMREDLRQSAITYLLDLPENLGMMNWIYAVIPLITNRTPETINRFNEIRDATVSQAITENKLAHLITSMTDIDMLRVDYNLAGAYSTPRKYPTGKEGEAESIYYLAAKNLDVQDLAKVFTLSNRFLRFAISPEILEETRKDMGENYDPIKADALNLEQYGFALNDDGNILKLKEYGITEESLRTIDNTKGLSGDDLIKLFFGEKGKRKISD